MGAIRNNQPRTITMEKIQSLIRELLAQGENAFPSERELVVRTGGSRGVIRRILEELEAEDRLRQTPNGRVINPQANQIPLLFASIGRNMVENRSWAKLWFTLSRLAPGYGIKPELVLVGWPRRKALPAIRYINDSPAKYLLVTCHELFAWNKFDFDSKFTIFPDEDAVSLHPHVISLDNREVGRMAARALYKAGYRNPAMFVEELDPPYLPFERRAAGFREECRKLGLALEEKDVFSIFLPQGICGKNIMQKVIAAGEDIAAAGCYDSVFAVADERVPMLCDTLLEKGIRLPEEMGIISLNGSNTSMSYRFPFTTVSAATEELAAKILETVSAAERGRLAALEPVGVVPKFHNIETLYRKKGNGKCV